MGQLVLSRKIGESIKIGTDITVTVLDVQDWSKVRLGIEAPAQVPVHRQEIAERIARGERKHTANRL